ncbi:MAG TPA: metallophosphatase domain-containing protein [Flavisolibacter sp.]|nr:metallophosphatase domain-containing protein [Flavisolibacter sp.]
MNFVVISDTHGKHRRMKLPKGDVLIHAGDVTMDGNDHQTEDFLNWFGKLDYPHKIFIAGNHDFYFEHQTEKEMAKLVPRGVIYLNDSGITIEGMRIWGSPVTPWYFDWAFNCHRGKEIAKHWKLIPQDTDLLITHGPPYGILDKIGMANHIGCEELLKKVKVLKPKLHIFGHVHESYGIYKNNGTTFVNASAVDANYELKNAALLVEREW